MLYAECRTSHECRSSASRQPHTCKEHMPWSTAQRSAAPCRPSMDGVGRYGGLALCRPLRHPTWDLCLGWLTVAQALEMLEALPTNIFKPTIAEQVGE